MKYSIGDLIVYGETGVCRVEEVVERPFLDSTQLCYKLQPLYQSCVIFTPVEGGAVFTRPIISHEDAEALINSIGSMTPEVLEITAPRILSEKYDSVIKTHDCREYVLLILSIYEKRKRAIDAKKKLSAVDERYLKKTEDLLFGELAAVLDIYKSEVGKYIEERIG